MNQKIHERYKEISLITASSEEIMKLLLGGAINSLETAIGAIETSNTYKRNASLTKAQRIILETMLYVEKDTEPGHKFYALLDYINQSLIISNLKNDKTEVIKLKNYLSALLESWNQKNT